ncbi:MAG: sugar nucleotide-binding protein [Candidatus Levybacteria bacterium]|nr:sugar nucleotide-binding protein [Candidatus Levybacteria bacterium]
MKNSSRQVLVLGATGMLGRIVYQYLLKHKRYIQGTSRNLANKNFIYLNFKKSSDLETLFENKSFSFVINCIGALRGSSNEKLKLLNIILPKALLMLSRKYNFKIINISTDAVFSNTAGEVYEQSIPNPNDLYGKSKFKGELSSNTINIRTSILGFDPIEHKGFLEFMLLNKSKEISGFIDTKWSGSTTLQLAKFIELLILENNFSNLLAKTNIVHFAPLGPITKYKILKTFSKLINYVKIIKSNGPKQTRILKTTYIEEIKLKKHTKFLEKALRELIEYDKDYIKTYKN